MDTFSLYEPVIGFGHEPPHGVAAQQGRKTADHADARRSGAGIYLRQSGASVKPSVSNELKGVHHGMIR